MKKFNNKIKWNTNVFSRKPLFAIGDAHFLIDKIKEIDAFNELFFRDGEGEIDLVSNLINKSVHFFTMQNTGSGWYPIFNSYIQRQDKQEIDGYYIDEIAAYNVWNNSRPDSFFSSNHIELINSLIEKSLKNKPLFKLKFPSKRILFMTASHEVEFYTDKNLKIDYSKPTDEIFEQLISIYKNENFATTSFLVDYLISEEFEVYKVDSLVEDSEWYVNYYLKYHGDSDIQKSQYKDTLKERNFFHGYYLRPIYKDKL